LCLSDFWKLVPPMRRFCQSECSSVVGLQNFDSGKEPAVVYAQSNSENCKAATLPEVQMEFVTFDASSIACHLG
jgi:hypothetical protein